MTFDLHEILASKRAYRQALAARGILEKLAMLDELRARAVTLRAARPPSTDSPILREGPSRVRSTDGRI
jgi:hypothetical protein